MKYKINTAFSLTVEVEDREDIVEEMDNVIENQITEANFLDNTSVQEVDSGKFLSREEMRNVFFGDEN